MSFSRRRMRPSKRYSTLRIVMLRPQKMFGSPSMLVIVGLVRSCVSTCRVAESIPGSVSFFSRLQRPPAAARSP